MIRQNLGDLNGYLFESLERLNEPDLSEAELKAEIQRSKVVSDIADKVIKNGKLVLDVERTYGRHEAINAKAPDMLNGSTIQIINEV